MVCLRNMRINTLYKGDNDDDDNGNNNNIIIIIIHNLNVYTQPCKCVFYTSDYENKQHVPNNY